MRQLSLWTEFLKTYLDPKKKVTVASVGDFSQGLAESFVKKCLPNAVSVFVGTQKTKAVFKIIKLITTGANIIKDCRDEPEPDPDSGRGRGTFGRVRNSEREHRGRVRRSVDPNEKVGTFGAKAAHYINAQAELQYVIFIENLATAGAAAQMVVIEDKLDESVIDLNSLSLGSISFGNQRVTPPPGLNEFNAVIPLQSDPSLAVRIDANLDIATSLLTWRLETIDASSGGLPSNPLAGFLPPNTEDGQGEGSVIFSVSLHSDLPHKTPIANKASIIFDNNAPIETNTWTNFIDKVNPESYVFPLAPEQHTSDFEVQWTGKDTEAGIKSYTILVSTDNSEPAIWLHNTTNTSAIFSGEPSHHYAFTSISTDMADNEELMKPKSDTETMVRTDVLPKKDSGTTY